MGRGNFALSACLPPEGSDALSGLKREEIICAGPLQQSEPRFDPIARDDLSQVLWHSNPPFVIGPTRS
jgi:hypothetical protein